MTTNHAAEPDKWRYLPSEPIVSFILQDTFLFRYSITIYTVKELN